MGCCGARASRCASCTWRRSWMRESPRGHPELAARFVADDARAHWHDQSLWWLRQKRDAAASVVPDWEALRDAAARIKAHVLGRLADYLVEFERNATAAAAPGWGGGRAGGATHELAGSPG